MTEPSVEEVDVEAVVADALPGVGGDALPLRDALREGGLGLVGLLLAINIVDEFPRTAAAAVLGPDIQATFGISKTVLLGMIGLLGVALVLTTLPAASLGDRMRRTRVVSLGTLAPTPSRSSSAASSPSTACRSRSPGASSSASSVPMAPESRR